MFHIGKSGSPTRCRAIVRPCPLGGEARLFAELGIEGPARPSPVEAREHGMYDTIYGAQLKQRQEAEARRAERDAQAVAPVLTYEQRVEQVHEQITAFRQEHADTMYNTSDRPWRPGVALTEAERSYLLAVDSIGNNVNELAAQKVDAEQAAEYETKQAEYTQRVKDIQNEIDEREKKIHAELAAIQQEREERDDKYWKREERNVLIDAYNKKLKELKKKISQQEAAAAAEYEALYGAAFKSALQDTGVSFVDRDHELYYRMKVENWRKVDKKYEAETRDAMAYYPKAWMDRFHEPLTLHRRRATTGGNVEYYLQNPGVKLYSGSRTTTIHEWGHIAEKANKKLGRAQRAFLTQEREHSSFTSVKTFTNQQSVITDSLIHEYSGVYYPGRDSDDYRGESYEVLTTGTEALFAGSYGGFRTDDTSSAPRHRNFVLGLLAAEREDSKDRLTGANRESVRSYN